MLLRADAMWGVNKVRKEEEAPRPGKEPQTQGMTPGEAHNVKRGTTYLGKQEFDLLNLVQESGGK